MLTCKDFVLLHFTIILFWNIFSILFLWKSPLWRDLCPAAMINIYAFLFVPETQNLQQLTVKSFIKTITTILLLTDSKGGFHIMFTQEAGSPFWLRCVWLTHLSNVECGSNGSILTARVRRLLSGTRQVKTLSWTKEKKEETSHSM